MKRLHGMVLRKLPGPFFGWLGTLLFLLLMQFLIEKLPDLAGKGLSVALIAEVIAYSLAYMLVLAVPMSVLLATLMAFGGLVESKAFAAAKSSGVSLLQLVWPVLVLGLAVSGGMAYFNNVVLPEANFRQKNLWRDIRVKKPGFALRPGVFYEELDDHALLVEEIPPDSSGVLRDVTIYDYTGEAREQTTIKAQRGRLRSKAGGTRIHLTLFDGEVHRSAQSSGRYKRLRFQTHELTLELPNTNFERDALREDYRSDRTTPTLQMIRHVDSLRTALAEMRRTARRLRETPQTVLVHFPEGRLHPPREDVLPFPEGAFSTLAHLFPEHTHWWPVALRVAPTTAARPTALLAGGEPHATPDGRERKRLRAVRQRLADVRPGEATHTLLGGRRGPDERWDLSWMAPFFERYL